MPQSHNYLIETKGYYLRRFGPVRIRRHPLSPQTSQKVIRRMLSKIMQLNEYVKEALRRKAWFPLLTSKNKPIFLKCAMAYFRWFLLKTSKDIQRLPNSSELIKNTYAAFEEYARSLSSSRAFDIAYCNWLREESNKIKSEPSQFNTFEDYYNNNDIFTYDAMLPIIPPSPYVGSVEMGEITLPKMNDMDIGNGDVKSPHREKLRTEEFTHVNNDENSVHIKTEFDINNVQENIMNNVFFETNDIYFPGYAMETDDQYSNMYNIHVPQEPYMEMDDESADYKPIFSEFPQISIILESMNSSTINLQIEGRDVSVKIDCY